VCEQLPDCDGTPRIRQAVEILLDRRLKVHLASLHQLQNGYTGERFCNRVDREHRVAGDGDSIFDIAMP
jgi:hypothetical protein